MSVEFLLFSEATFFIEVLIIISVYTCDKFTYISQPCNLGIGQ